MRKVNLLLICVILASCGVRHKEKKFVQFHDYHNDIAVKWCAKWYPMKDSATKTIEIIPAHDTIKLPGELVYGDCDSVYQAALALSEKTGQPIVLPKIPIKTFTKLVHDTVKVRYDNYITDTKQLASLQAQYSQQTERLAVSKDKLHTSRIVAGIEAILLLLVGLFTYFKLKARIV
jgi:hypothetical protein